MSIVSHDNILTHNVLTHCEMLGELKSKLLDKKYTDKQFYVTEIVASVVDSVTVLSEFEKHFNEFKKKSYRFPD